jgi:ABC-2 type transport system permease protein
MNATFAEAAGPDLPRPAPPPAKPLAGTLLTLVRREFWEHRYLWLAPLVVEGLLLTLFVVVGHGHLNIHDDDFHGVQDVQSAKVAAFTIVQWVATVPLWLVMFTTLSYYTLDCLYAERKDRSILFWKSLPVSDGLTVTSKLLTALVVVPLGIFALALVGDLLLSGIIGVRMATGNLPQVVAWSTIEWLRAEVTLLLIVLLAALWYAPVAGALMLISAAAQRSPFLWATVPLLVAPLLERIAIGTHHVWDFIRYRSDGIWRTLIEGADARLVTHDSVRPLGSLLHILNFGRAFTDTSLWLGVAATVLFVFLAVRVRRYRDDT